MFENGLFASFIPEILMVLAYLFCFVAPGFKTEKQTTELTQNVVHVSYNHSITNSVYVLKKLDHKFLNQFVEAQQALFIHSGYTHKNTFSEKNSPKLSNYYQYHFSRPPPVF